MDREKNKKPLRIKVKYLGRNLQKIAGKKNEVIHMPVGSRSENFIDRLVELHPKIFEKYGPGFLGFELNGRIPKAKDRLSSGDRYEFCTWTENEIKKADNFQMPKWMECTWRRVPCGKDGCPICGRIKRDRQRHIEHGEDPDDMKSVFKDVGRNFKEVLEMIKKDAEEKGFDITNIDNIQEPPEPEEFSLYRKIQKWRDSVYSLASSPTVGFWIETEEAQDLLWYANTLMAKVYRQLCNHWHIKKGDDYGVFDCQYTGYVLQKCLKILSESLQKIIQNNPPQKEELNSIFINLSKLEKEITKI